MTKWQGRLEIVRSPRVDLLFASAGLVVLEAQCWLGRGLSARERWVTAVASLLLVAPILGRRSRPGVAFVSASLVVAVQALVGGQLLSGPLPTDVGPVLVMLALAYSAGAWLDARASAISGALAVALVVGGGVRSGRPGLAGVSSAIFYSILIVAPGWFVGRAAHERARRIAAFRDLAAEAASERDARESAVIAHERARIGTELQDIIAHSVSAMVVQAGGARLLIRRDPDRAREGILNIEQTGREALGDLRRLLGVLRKNDDPRALSPQPGLGQVGSLLDSQNAAGADWKLHCVGEPTDLTPGVDLVAYRVIEAALASASGHDVIHGVVTVNYRGRVLELEIEGDRPSPNIDHELRAIAQRVSLYAGALRLASTDRSFTVFARLPVRTAVVA
jgi:signal transduction histidine kinase